MARFSGNALQGSGLAPEIAADQLYPRTIVVGEIGNLGRRDVLIARRGHLERRQEISPQLETMHAAKAVAAMHLLVHDALACDRPLHVA